METSELPPKKRLAEPLSDIRVVVAGDARVFTETGAEGLLQLSLAACDW